VKIIFLDIDGVLNSMDNLNSLIKLSRNASDKYGELFDIRCCNCLDYIISNTNAKIVISSSWKEMGLKRLKEMWIDRKLPGEILDITKDLKTTRGEEIDNWVNTNNPSSYLIIDDTPDFFTHHDERIIITNSESGLTDELSDKAIRILNG